MERLPEILLMLLGFGSIVFLAYITTRYVGNKAGKAMLGKHVTIVETVSLGMDKRLHLVKAGGQYLLIASTSKSVEFISEIRLGEEEETEPVDSTSAVPGIFDFKSIFDKYSGMYKSRKISSVRPARQQDDMSKPESERFRNNLDRLTKITQKYENQVSKNGDEFTNEK